MDAIAQQYNENEAEMPHETAEEEGDEYNVIESTEDYDEANNAGGGGNDGDNANYNAQEQEDANYDNQQQYGESYQETIEEIIARTGYNHECTTGQRKYGGPPPNYNKLPPGPGHEVYVGKIPQDIMENELILLFEQCGSIYELRLMMNPQNSLNKGFCFVTFCEKSEAQAAADMYNGYEIRPRKFLKVNVSIPNTRLYLGNLPKFKNKDQIFEEVSLYVEGLKDVIIYDMPDDPNKKNRGFAFLDFITHKNASDAKKKLSSENVLVFNHTCVVDWADPQEEPNDEVMSKVKVLYIRNLKSDVSEQDLTNLFAPFGSLEKVKKIKDYAFIHYNERESAIKALEQLNNTTIKDSVMNITLARPPIDPKIKEQRKMQHRMMATSIGQNSMFGMPPGLPAFPMPVRGGGMRGGMRGNRGAPGGPMRGMRGRGGGGGGAAGGWGPAQVPPRDHTKVPYYEEDFSNTYDDFGTNFDEYQNEYYDESAGGDDQYYDDGSYDYNSFDNYQSFGQVPQTQPQSRGGSGGMRMKSQGQARGMANRSGGFSGGGMNRGGGGGGGMARGGRGTMGGPRGGGGSRGGSGGGRGGGPRGGGGGGVGGGGNMQRGRGKSGGPPPGSRGGRGGGGRGGGGGGGGLGGGMKRKTDPPVFGMDLPSKQGKFQNAPRPFGNSGGGGGGGGGNNQRPKPGQGQGGNRRPPQNFQGGPQNKQQQPRQQQQFNKGKPQQKQDSWQTQPIVQKPLSQMSGFGEQWF